MQACMTLAYLKRVVAQRLRKYLFALVFVKAYFREPDCSIVLGRHSCCYTHLISFRLASYKRGYRAGRSGCLNPGFFSEAKAWCHGGLNPDFQAKGQSPYSLHYPQRDYEMGHGVSAQDTLSTLDLLGL